jgi:hypothetical protein
MKTGRFPESLHPTNRPASAARARVPTHDPLFTEVFNVVG